MKAKIYVTHKKGILDPQGKTVETALISLGYNKASNVHIGKYIELDLQEKDKERAEKLVKEMCEKLLSNPIIEQYRFEVSS
ncbi:phosphoribosylformylglycinamidine synthase [candidate division WOR-1 bacterium RIFOXYA2_FULL_36_21]|nr:MAG: phosphoribosylformylglycinamidine synthase [candidate division WOR-1 bacterium RIFOXYA2_FULL_36_21]OGC19001.1 MAG: phosphoribosylformylglycinamidine synthase [candidate division WOR-1 bacterium RIFOXYA12_FULL_36_13]